MLDTPFSASNRASAPAAPAAPPAIALLTVRVTSRLPSAPCAALKDFASTSVTPPLASVGLQACSSSDPREGVQAYTLASLCAVSAPYAMLRLFDSVVELAQLVLGRRQRLL